MKKTGLFRNWIAELFKDERGAVSIKPVIAVAGAFFLIAGMITSLFVPLDPADSLVNGVVAITCIGMGADTVDKFSFKSTRKKKTTEEPEV